MTAVLITGASSGIGLCAAELFAADGADVALLARGEEGLEKAAASVRAHGRRAVVVPADVTDRAAVDAAVARAADELGGLDVLVSCAAATVHGPFRTTSAEDFDRAFDATFTGAVNVVRAALPHLERTDGVAVVIGSLVSRTVLPTFTSYAAAKHALRGFLHTLRIELRAQGSKVRIAQLHPGLVDTPLWDQTAGDRPRRPPEGYDPKAVAQELVALAHDPKPERMIGGEAWLLDIAYNVSRPVGRLVMVAVDRYLRSGSDRPRKGDPLREPTGTGEARSGLPIDRPSLLRTAARKAPWPS